jgi:ABC-type uncharacterized transport system ATPase subunit
MSHGRLVFDGTVSELRQRFGGEQQSLEAMYLALTAAGNSAARATHLEGSGRAVRITNE